MVTAVFATDTRNHRLSSSYHDSIWPPRPDTSTQVSSIPPTSMGTETSLAALPNSMT